MIAIDVFLSLYSSIRCSAQWRDLHSSFVISCFMNGNLKQCTVTLKELQSYRYTHCWLLSRLHGKFIPLKLDCDDASLETKGTFNVVANEDPTWLYRHCNTEVWLEFTKMMSFQTI